MFWMPDQVRHDELGLFTKSLNLFYQQIIMDKKNHYVNLKNLEK